MTREPEVAKQLSCMSPRIIRDDDIDHVKEDSLVVFWRSAVTADDVEHAEFFCGKLVQFLRHIAIMSEVAAILAFAVGLSVGLQVAMTTCTNPQLQVAHELEYQVVKPSDPFLFL